MKTREIARESLRNVRAAAARSTVFVAIVTVFFFAAGFNEMETGLRILELQQRLVAQGAYVAQAISIEEGAAAVPRASCDALASNEKVVAAGSMTNPGGSTRSFTVAPASLGAEVFVSEGFLRVVAPGSVPDVIPPGWVLGHQLGDELGVQVGDSLQSRGQIVTVAAVIDPSQRLSAGSRWAFNVVAPAKHAELCYVEFRPEVWTQGIELLRYTFPNQKEVAILPRVDETTLVDPATEFSTRTSRFGPPLAVLLVQLIVATTLLSRRREFALISVLAGSRSLARSIAFVELGILIIASAVLAAFALTAFGTSRGIPDSSWTLGYGAILAAAGASLAATPFGISWVVRGTVATLLQD